MSTRCAAGSPIQKTAKNRGRLVQINMQPGNGVRALAPSRKAFQRSPRIFQGQIPECNSGVQGTRTVTVRPTHLTPECEGPLRLRNDVFSKRPIKKGRTLPRRRPRKIGKLSARRDHRQFDDHGPLDRRHGLCHLAVIHPVIGLQLHPHFGVPGLRRLELGFQRVRLDFILVDK